MSAFKPMLASKVKPEKLSYPLIVQVKLDGIRASVVDGKLVSRTLKLIPNKEIQAALGRPEFNGLDGELIVGRPEAQGCMQATTSFVMAPNKTGGDWTYHVFDKWDESHGYKHRWLVARDLIGPRMDMLDYSVVDDADELDQYESLAVSYGHEGVIVRSQEAHYKFGRATATAGELGKIKRFDDSEAIIFGVYEEMHNGNEPTQNALGRTERSSVQANKTGKGTLGGFEVRDLTTGVEFRVGTGFNARMREEFWEHSQALLGQTIKYKSFSIGVKEKPRHPVFLGFRDMEIDG